jgi:hypothetical protein
VRKIATVLEAETTQPSDRRDALRAKAVAEMPWWYNPWAHLAFPSAVGLGMIALALSLLEDVRPVELLTVPVVLVLVNFNEWFVHRNVLHRRLWPLEVLFWRHTPEHHVIYVRDDMAMRTTQEFRLVLIPSYGILAIFVTTLPVTFALATLVSWNVAALWVATSMGYVVAYEWLHLSYHLPADSRIGRSRAIGLLRRHHAWHHTPELMQTWNFNVTVPLADWVLGTIHPGTRAAAADATPRIRPAATT